MVTSTSAVEKNESVPVVWHEVDRNRCIDRLGSDVERGLTAAQVERRQVEFGPNVLAQQRRRPPWLAFADQFRNFLIIILLVAAAVSFVVSGELKTPIVILLVVVLNAVLGFVMENRAERSLDALRSMLVVRAKVLRDGRTSEVDSAELVPGDVVLIESGAKVPADGRLLDSASLEVQEATLTGESAPVAKSADATLALDAALGDRTNVVYMNTTVTRGRALVLVTSTGMETEIGRIAHMLESTTIEATPLQRQLDHVAHVLAALAGVVVALVFTIGLLRGEPIGDLFLTAVALAVASVPEGLPAVLAVTLALGAHQMAKQHAVIKRLASVETLGCTTIICSDKTGTLTMNEMTARAIYLGGSSWTVTGEGYGSAGKIVADRPTGSDAAELNPVMLGMALCNDSIVRDGEVVGDPTEAALTVLATKSGLEVIEARRTHPRRWEVPFDSALKFMATIHDLDDGSGPSTCRMFVKGAPDVLIGRSSTWLDDAGKVSPLDDAGRATLARRNDELAGQGLRVIAIAWRDLDDDRADASTPEERLDCVTDLQLVALIGIVDPPRPEAAEAISLCHRAGISVKMITGDHATTAQAIATQLGIRGEAVTGAQLDEMSDDELADRLDAVGVFARVAPEHKLRLVRALQARRDVVAMTGDGVNDAPALRQADIGVAMGITGTEVTKEAATMVLTDDNFATIVEAVRRGRTIYDNIVKFVRFQLSTTIGFAITFLTATATGIATGKPFTALQILWVNIIMDGPPAMALGVDPPVGNTMQRGPRPATERILMPSRVARLVAMGLVMATGTLIVMVTAPDYSVGVAVAGTVAGTMAFTTFVFFQFFNLVNCRAEHGTAFRRDLFTNGRLWAIVGVVAILQVCAVHIGPLQTLFDTTALTAAQWAVCLGVASSILWLEELRKFVAPLVLRTPHTTDPTRQPEAEIPGGQR